ncbi:MAG: CvpA family protein [Burkholderiales bacterium]
MTGPWNAADLAMLAVLLLSMAVGAWRGLAFELMSLLGWFAAYLAAQWFNAVVAPHVPVGSPGSGLNHAAAFALTFIAALIVWGLLAQLLKMLIHATPLSGIDRLLGAAFGVLRGGVLLLAVAAVVTRTPWVESPTWQHSVGAAWLKVVITGLKPALPASIADHLLT